MTAGIPINPKVLKQCRLQVGLEDINEAIQVTGTPKLAAYEEGAANPTYKQIQKIAEAYCVPGWVFNENAEEIPKEYNFSKESNPVFRSLKNNKVKLNYQVIKLINHVVSRRKFLLEIYEDDDDRDVPKFNKNELNANDIIAHGGIDPIKLADKASSWLGINIPESIEGKNVKEVYVYYKERIEEKGVLVFMTSPYNHWSKIEPKIMRGLALYDDIFPIIVVNGTDAVVAKTFTLIHELGHILRRDTMLDEESNILDSRNTNKSEVFCNQFAANLLMPHEQFAKVISKYSITEDIPSDSKKLDKLGKGFGVSPARNIAIEKINYYGKPYIGSIFQLYYDEKISLLRLCNLLDLKNTGYVDDIEKIL